MSRQNYYKHRRARERLSIDEELILELVRRERKRHPRLGSRKLLHVISEELKEAKVSIGRDRFFRLLLRHNLLIRRRKGHGTTFSGHGFRVCPNRAKDLVLRGCNQLWVSDITYIRTSQGFVYLSLIMDAFSRMIVGYDCSDSLEMEGSLRSLKMALRQLKADVHPLHHSDREIQYCCRTYIEQLEKAGLSISMTEENHCYENAQAERLNGVLKQEYGLGETIASKTLVRQMVREAVALYNQHRPHGALNNRTPMSVHRVA
jgi:putative transposase